MSGDAHSAPEARSSAQLAWARDLIADAPRLPTSTGLRPRARRALQARLLALLAGSFTHQRNVSAALAEAVQNTADLISDRLDSVAARLDSVDARLASLAERLADDRQLWTAWRAELQPLPYMAGTPFSQFDSVVGPVIGFCSGESFAAASSPYAGFEDVFRGPPELLRELLEPYLALVADRGPVLDLGCGAGDFLAMLAEHGIEGRGVDSDPGMVSRCRERGLTVASGDLVEQLAQAGDRTLGTIFCAQVIEHLPVTQLWKLLDLALVKLVPGGRMIAETVNPHSVAALKMFWIDPTHQSPIFPEVALAMAGITGFAPAFVFAPGDSDFEAARFTASRYALVATSPLA